MKIPIYQVDAFTSTRFAGNPAAVCLLEDWLADQVLQAIAAENNLSETAFLVRNAGGFDLRWFTPVTEVALCGHATLASAFVLFTHRHWPESTICFRTRRSGELLVSLRDDLLELDFPALPAQAVTPPTLLAQAIPGPVLAVLAAAEDLLVELSDAQSVRKLRPDLTALAGIACRGVIVTAPGEDCDFVSRFFAPRFGIPEDPVTGSAHCVLIPYWAGKLGKKVLAARQVSARGGELWCQDCGDRVRIAGRAVVYLEGTISV
ncbi:MAG: PhzF family phenazine biosynthesis protein [Desulfobulbaceae bacterium]|nr:PhzF family phenazine biosynthesis protein [Desulfobulbaceae bacterium]